MEREHAGNDAKELGSMSRIVAYVEGEETPVEYPYSESQLDKCPWCGLHRGIDYLELCSLLEVAGNEDRVLTWPGKGDAIAIVSHAKCGRSIGYGIRLPEFHKKAEFWRNHIAKKRWDDNEYHRAFDYLSVRPLPFLDDSEVQQISTSGRIQTYFIQAETGGPVKIGKSRDASARLRGLQTGHPERLRVITLIDGDVESELHQKFAHLRTAGEWFRYTQELTDFLLGVQ
jgi:hypothetical protein